MNHLYAIRGWVEGDHEIIEGVRSLVAGDPLARHWHFALPAVGQHGFAFFGAVIADDGRDAVKAQLSAIASRAESHFSDIHEVASGYFAVTCLTGAAPLTVWRLGGGRLVEE